MSNHQFLPRPTSCEAQIPAVQVPFLVDFVG